MSCLTVVLSAARETRVSSHPAFQPKSLHIPVGGLDNEDGLAAEDEQCVEEYSVISRPNDHFS
jgi:hypothetical protein